MLEELKRLSAAATPGPWETEQVTECGAFSIKGPSFKEGRWTVRTRICEGMDWPNGEFISAMRNNIGKMVAVCEAAKGVTHCFDCSHHKVEACDCGYDALQKALKELETTEGEAK